MYIKCGNALIDQKIQKRGRGVSFFLVSGFVVNNADLLLMVTPLELLASFDQYCLIIQVLLIDKNRHLEIKFFDLLMVNFNYEGNSFFKI